MKKNPVLFLVVFIISMSSAFSQEIKTEREIRRQAAKVDTLYTVQERANIEEWFYERVNEMNLAEEERDEYDAIVYSYIFQMSRLNDKDKDYSINEIHVKFDALVDQMNAELKQLLTTEQYINHLENFNEIVRSIDNKYGWKDEE